MLVVLESVIAYAMVALSFLVLRRREPDLPRPFRVRFGGLVGDGIRVINRFSFALYAGKPFGFAVAKRVGNLIGWCLLGAVMYFWVLKIVLIKVSELVP